MSNERNAKFRVIPGLSINNKELLKRVKNRSVVIDASGNQYSTDPQISAAARKSRVENARDMLIDQAKINSLEKSIKKDVRDYQIEQAKEAGRREAKASKGGEDAK